MLCPNTSFVVKHVKDCTLSAVHQKNNHKHYPILYKNEIKPSTDYMTTNTPFAVSQTVNPIS